MKVIMNKMKKSFQIISLICTLGFANLSHAEDCGAENANGQFYCSPSGVRCVLNLNNQLYCENVFCTNDHGIYTCPLPSTTIVCQFSGDRLYCGSKANQ